MAANIEIKAQVHDLERLQRLAAQLSDTPCQVIPQEDTFFNCSQGRLKIRELGIHHGQLVYYQREDITSPKLSEYYIFETDDPAGLKSFMEHVFGIRGVVSKVRHLYLVGQTRIHLDEVKGLGNFVELEVVMKPGQTEAEGQEIAQNLMHELGIKSEDLIDSAYMDLLEK